MISPTLCASKCLVSPAARVRVDTHAYAAHDVLPTYDSMIGKLIVTGY